MDTATNHVSQGKRAVEQGERTRILTIQGYSGENLAVIRHLALNLLTQEKSDKGGV